MNILTNHCETHIQQFIAEVFCICFDLPLNLCNINNKLQLRQNYITISQNEPYNYKQM